MGENGRANSSRSTDKGKNELLVIYDSFAYNRKGHLKDGNLYTKFGIWVFVEEEVEKGLETQSFMGPGLYIDSY